MFVLYIATNEQPYLHTLASQVSQNCKEQAVISQGAIRHY